MYKEWDQTICYLLPLPSHFLQNYFTPGEISHNLKLAEATKVQIL